MEKDKIECVDIESLHNTEKFQMRISPATKAKVEALKKRYNYRSSSDLLRALIDAQYEKLHDNNK